MAPKKHLPMPPLAYADKEFLGASAARPLRILAEYSDPLMRLRKENIADTIVIFGSARILPRQKAERRLHAIQKKFGKKRTPEMKAAVRQARSIMGMSRYYEEARELSRRITEWSKTMGSNPRRFVICSGGGPGIMEAANRGAQEAGGPTIGLSIELPREQRPNDYITPELNLCFHYFFMRKLWFAQVARALIVFPGGFGTMDEMWEILTLLQTAKISPQHMILIYGREYWDKVLNFEEMVRRGTVSQKEVDVLQYADSVEEAYDLITCGLEKDNLSLDGDWAG
jgi:uncharacterized protein (TIGR00730 family)